jgi:predicted DNA-binding transcriptional regulator AlpA
MPTAQDDVSTASTEPKRRGNRKGGKRPRVARELTTALSEDDVLLTAEETCTFFGGPTSPLDLSTIYRGAAEGRYPLPVQIGPNSVRWLLSECRAARDRMIAARGKARLPAQPASGTPGGAA